MFSFLTPPKFSEPQQTRQAQLLHYILLFAAVTAIFGALIMVLVSRDVVPAIRNIIIIIIAAVFGGMYSIRRGYTTTVSIAFTFFVWIILTILAFTNAHAAPLYIMGYNIVVLMAGLLLGRYWLMGFTLLSIVSALPINALYEQGRLLQTGQLDIIDVAIGMQLSTFLWTAICVYLVVNSLQMALNTIQEREQSLAKAVKHLQTGHQKLSESETRYRQLIENANDLIQNIGADGRLQYANRYWRQTMGYDESEINTLHFLDIVHPNQHTHYQKLFDQLAQGEQFNQVDIIFVTKTGQNIIAEGNINAQFENGRFAGIRGIFRDVTERRAAEAALKQRQFVLETLNHISKSVAITLETGPLLTTIIQFAVDTLEGTSGYICDWDPNTDRSTVLAEYFSPHANEKERVSDLGVTYYLSEELNDPVHWIFQPPYYYIQHTDGSDLHPREKDHMEQYGANSILYTPLRISDNSFGYIEVWESRQKRIFSAEEIDLVQAIAQQVANNIRNAQLHQTIQTNLVRTQALYQVTQSLIAPQPLRTLLKNSVTHIAHALNIDRVFINLLNLEEGKVTHFIRGGLNDKRPPYISYDMMMKTLIGWVIRHGEPAIVTKEMINDDRVDDTILQFRRDEGYGPMVVIPLKYQERILGTITVINRREDPNFNRDDVDLMLTMANQISVAIENARLNEVERAYVAALETQNEELNAFSHTVAHDLKNPLSGMLAHIELFKEYYRLGKYNDIGKNLYRLSESGHTMSTIIDELLLLSQVRQTDVQTAPLNMDEIVQNVLHRLKFDIERTSAHVILPESWPTALGHGGWVEEIWINYLTNAIKYGGNPAVIELGSMVEGETAVKFWVKDNGLGIPKAQQANLFTPFERLDQIDIKGHGLGLSIVQRIAKKLDGHVGVQSETDQGSTFYFTLPKVS